MIMNDFGLKQSDLKKITFRLEAEGAVLWSVLVREVPVASSVPSAWPWHRCHHRQRYLARSMASLAGDTNLDDAN